MTQGTLYLLLFLLAAAAGLGGMFLYGWLRRKERMPKVRPLTQADDDAWR
jgi:hypothetical protein